APSPGSMGHRSGQALDITAGHRRGPAGRPAAKNRWTNIQGKSNAKTRSPQNLFNPLTGKTTPSKPPPRPRGGQSTGDKHECGAEDKHEPGQHPTSLQTEARRVGSVALRAEGRRH